MATKQFKAESKRLLDMMINSIYTHKEIFLRELISNASDAMDKLYYRTLQENLSGVSREDFSICLTADRTTRTLTIEDNGIGMTKEELESNLGTIAKSGSFAFKKENEKTEDVDIIGQFGVGFYSAFMVADCVTVESRAFGSNEAWCWQSKGAAGYTVEPTEKASHGTKIMLHIKDNDADETYDEYLDSYRLQDIIKKYSDYIRYPIRMDVEKTRMKEGTGENGVAPEYEQYTENEILNSMVPLWKKNKNEITEDEYNAFYKSKFSDYNAPARIVHSATEGAATYNALLFIPSAAPFNYYTREYEKGLQLYASGVLIMEKCADLLPDHFSFVKGLVDSQDLSLNISREMLQHDRQLKIIASRLEKKIHSELLSMLNNNRETYETFFKNFGLQLKFGLYNDYGVHKDMLQDLVMFISSAEKKLVTLKEYVERMPEDQKYIYYACGDTADKIEKLPQTELVRDKGFEILYLTDDVDEFALQMMHTFMEKEFKSVSSGDLGFETETANTDNEQHKPLLDALTAALDGKVKEVKISARLKTHPVCLSSEGALSIEMEKVLASMPNQEGIRAQRVLELNAAHPIFEKLTAMQAAGDSKLDDFAKLLYDQALLIEGLPVEDPVAFSARICALMAE